MKLTATEIAPVMIVEPRRIEDERGYFSETYRRDMLARAGIDDEFVQENQSYSAKPWTLRGLHFQAPPHAQAKIVRVIRGAIFDVAVDIRYGSPTFGRHVAVTLSARDGRQLYVPVGFAHGFLTLEPDTEVSYFVSDYYSAADDRGILWCDPDLAIAWPLAGHEPLLSPRDRAHPRLRESPAYF